VKAKPWNKPIFERESASPLNDLIENGLVPNPDLLRAMGMQLTVTSTNSHVSTVARDNRPEETAKLCRDYLKGKLDLAAIVAHLRKATASFGNPRDRVRKHRTSRRATAGSFRVCYEKKPLRKRAA
jgi:hypothetical protein